MSNLEGAMVNLRAHILTISVNKCVTSKHPNMALKMAVGTITWIIAFLNVDGSPNKCLLSQ